jgi:hypothetical protein
MKQKKTQYASLMLATLVAWTTSCAPPGESEVVAQTTQANTTCAPSEPEVTRQFRQLSLDLRGMPPTIEELEMLRGQTTIPPGLVDMLLQSNGFLETVAEWHADILWPNLDGFLITVGGIRLTRDGPNPELAVALLDRITPETTCPTTGAASLTAVGCCTSSQPTHPACCVARNGRYNPEDPACIEKSRRTAAVFTIGGGVGDKPLRGGSGSLGCDDALEYPPVRVAAADARWTHEASGRPFYVSPRSGQRRYYYDTDNVPLPYDDWTHCPNYCRRNTPGVGTAFTTADYVPKQRTVGTTIVVGDHPDATCPPDTSEVVNTCDNIITGNNLDTDRRIRREGYVLQRQYWASNHLVKICAYEAQERTNSVYTGAPCSPAQRMDASCGCGPQGIYCSPSQGRLSPNATRTESRLREALNDEPLKIVQSVIQRGEDYYNAYTTRRSFITGPLSLLYREQTTRMQGLAISAPTNPSMLPNLPYENESWSEYVRGPEHSGVLTTPAYLGRFPTWRSRINQFRTSLLCRPFAPPEGGLPSPDDACTREPNLAQRCGCQHCHSAIEPLGAYWGRWAERSAIYLDPRTFPAFDPNCAQCANTGQNCTARCRANYVTQVSDATGSRYAGTLFSALYRSSEEMSRMEQGPSALVSAALSSGEMQTCTVNTLWRRLVNRPMNDQETQRVLPELLRGFEANHHNYRELVRAIVTSPAYRRID